jgi:hypothetical protein
MKTRNSIRWRIAMPAPDWFGTKNSKFRDFLVGVYRKKLPIPSIKLRIAGTKMGQMVKDPSNMTAFDLLQTALGNPGGSGDIQKDVSALLHEHESGNPERKHTAEQPRGHVDERGIGGTEEEGVREPEESEKYYLNLALKSLSKGKIKTPDQPHGGSGNISHTHIGPDRYTQPTVSHRHPKSTHKPLYEKVEKHKGPGIAPHPHGRKRGYRSGTRFRGTAPKAEENPMHTHAELGGIKHRHPRGDAPHTHTSEGGILFKRQITPPPHHSASASIYPRPKHDLEVVRNAVAPGKKAPVKPKAQPKVTFKPVAPEPDMDAPPAAGDPLKPDIGQKAGGQGKINVPAPGRRRNFMRVVKGIQDKPISQQNDFPSDKGTTFVDSGQRINRGATSQIISPTKETEGADGKLLDTVLQPPPGVTTVRPEAGMQGKNVGSDAKEIQVVNQGVAMNPQADLDERGAVKGSGSVS